MKRGESPVNQIPPAMVDKQSGWLERLSFRFFPGRCILCRGPATARDICDPCLADLTVTGPACRQCARPLEGSDQTRCGACLHRSPAFDQTLAPYIYTYPVNGLIQHFKFRRQLAAGRVLGSLLADWVAATGQRVPDALVPVPMSRMKLIRRGFNQSLELAVNAGSRLHCPVLPQALGKTRATPAQAELSARQRQRNLRKAFSVKHRPPLPAHIALVDDVMTTGSTLHECAKALKAGGAETVDAWVVARAL